MCWSARISIISFTAIWAGAMVLETLASSGMEFIPNATLRTSIHWMCIFVLTFSLVQYLEAWIWISQEGQKKQQNMGESKTAIRINNLATRAIYSALWMQPFVQCIALLLFSEFNPTTEECTEIIFDSYDRLLVPWCSLVGIYSIFQMIKPWRRTYQRWSNGLYSTAGCGGHLVWLAAFPHTKDETSTQLQIETQLKKVLNKMGTGDDEFFGMRRSFIYLTTWILPVFFLPHDEMRVLTLIFIAASILITQLLTNRDEFSSLWCFFAGAYLFIPYYLVFYSCNQ